ncbi:hypothetical protein HY995_03900 [Candidatus Micrarchaeota archaeon]|nr:hypothetical protein [Candidatus Micrarchaeota archaeon]MBI5177202.1 hypothetical protein [Candidatus Micrarchaeota archaeon]
MAFLFGDQLLWYVIAFAGAAWVASRVAGRDVPLVPLAILGIVGAVFLSDLGTFLSGDFTAGIVILALFALVAQALVEVTLVQGVAVALLAWIVGSAVIAFV